MDFTVRKVAIEWLGHSSFKITAATAKISIFIDPFVLPEIARPADIILVTHEHYDHFAVHNIKALLKPETAVLLPKSCSRASDFKELETAGAKLQFVEPGSKLNFNNGAIRIEAMPAYNINKPYHPQGRDVGYVITLLGVRIYHAGDTDNIPEMKRLSEYGIDAAILPIGGKYTMDEQEAAEAIKAISPKYAIPMHYGKITGGDPYKFKELVGNACEVKIL